MQNLTHQSPIVVKTVGKKITERLSSSGDHDSLTVHSHEGFTANFLDKEVDEAC